MKSTVQEGLSFFQAFEHEVAEEVLRQVQAMGPTRWFHRAQINSRPTRGSKECDYYFCGDRQQPKELNKLLRQLAPKIEGTVLGEACINRYDVGGYMPEHVDLAMYRYNVVVMLCDNNDGIEIEGVFYSDSPGRAIQFPAKSPPHRVPPVKHQRFVLIYLYE